MSALRRERTAEEVALVRRELTASEAAAFMVAMRSGWAAAKAQCAKSFVGDWSVAG